MAAWPPVGGGRMMDGCTDYGKHPITITPWASPELEGGFHISTADISVTYTKERPRVGAIGTVRARACPLGLIPRVDLHLGGTQWMSLTPPT